MSTDIYKDHSDFFYGFGIPTDATLAWGLIDEEVNKELFPALFQYNKSPTLENKVELADAIVDSVYVLFQLARSVNIPFNACWDEVHKSNMAKMVDGKVIRRTDGKVLKPEGWVPPDLWSVLHQLESATEYSKKEYEGISNVKPG
jgi:hypothetical protein